MTKFVQNSISIMFRYTKLFYLKLHKLKHFKIEYFLIHFDFGKIICSNDLRMLQNPRKDSFLVQIGFGILLGQIYES